MFLFTGFQKIVFYSFLQKYSNEIRGCFDLLCSPGFVQINKEIALGGSLNPISVYAGSQYELHFLVWKVVKNYNLINLSNTSNFWIHIYMIISYVVFLYKKIHSNKCLQIWLKAQALLYSYGFIRNSLCLKFLFLGLFIITFNFLNLKFQVFYTQLILT